MKSLHYCNGKSTSLQRKVICHSRFLAWCLRKIGKDAKVWYVATYADTGTFNPATGLPHSGAIYRATSAVYCGLTKGERVEGYVHEGKRHSMRRGPKTMRIGDIPAGARIVRSSPKHRYCWAVGATPLVRAFRRRKLAQRMDRFRFVSAYQPRLLARVWQAMVAGLRPRRMQSERG